MGANGEIKEAADIELQEKGDGNKHSTEGADVSTPFISTNEPPDDEESGSTPCIKPGLRCRYTIYNPRNIPEAELTSRKLGQDFRSRASLVGLTQVHESPDIVKKAFWILITIASLVLLIAHTTSLIYKYAQHSVNIELEVKTEKRIEFPAVTVCNNNMVVAAPLEIDPFTQLPIYPSTRELDKHVDYLFLNNHTYGHQREDLIVNASFDSQLLEMKDFKLILNPHYGNCYTFNIDGKRKTRRALPGYGLRLRLNIESYKYNNFTDHNPASWRGAIVKVHRPETEAIMAEGGIILTPNTISRLAIKNTKYSRINGPHARCITDNDPNKPNIFSKQKYTQQHCENTCLQKQVIKKCCCYIKTITRDTDQLEEDWHSCSLRDLDACEDSEDDCWLREWQKYDTGRLPCNECAQLCNDVIYDTTVMSAEWPTSTYVAGILLDELHTSKRLKNQLDVYGLFNDSVIAEEVIRENFLEAEIYFESMTTTYINEVPAIRFAEFASEMGSAIGFWVGWSLWTVCQFCEFLADLITLAVQKCRRRTANSSSCSNWCRKREVKQPQPSSQGAASS